VPPERVLRWRRSGGAPDASWSQPPFRVFACVFVLMAALSQMRLEEVDELLLQTGGMSAAARAFVHCHWIHLTDACDVRLRVRLIRWLNGCFVGKQKETGVRAAMRLLRCNC
jgi:hypothetical protein